MRGWREAALGLNGEVRAMASASGFLDIPKVMEKISHKNNTNSTAKKSHHEATARHEVTYLQREGLSEVYSYTAIVFAQHSEHPPGHAPQTLVFLGLSLKW